MPGIRGRVFYWYLKFNNKRADQNATLQRRRVFLEDGARYLPMPRKVKVIQTEVGNIAAEWLQPIGAPDDRTVLHLHGGAYTMGSCATHRALAARIAIASLLGSQRT